MVRTRKFNAAGRFASILILLCLVLSSPGWFAPQAVSAQDETPQAETPTPEVFTATAAPETTETPQLAATETPASESASSHDLRLEGRIEGDFSAVYLVDTDLMTETLVTRVEQANLWLPMYDRFMTVSPDGKYGTYVTADGLTMANTRLWLVDVDGLVTTELAQFAADFWTAPIVWSPDSTMISFAKTTPAGAIELWVIDAATGEQSLAASTGAFQPGLFQTGSPVVSWPEEGMLQFVDQISENEFKTVYSVDLGTGEISSVRVQKEGGELSEVGMLASLPCGVTQFAQNDPLWSSTIMQTCNSSIGSLGCALTSAAMVFRYYGVDTNPPLLNTCLGNSACPIIWATAAANCSASKVKLVAYSEFDWAAMEADLNLGRPVIVGMSSGSNTHFVVAVSGSGTSAEGYTINDPWSGVVRSLSYYSSWTFYGLRRLSGTPWCQAGEKLSVSTGANHTCQLASGGAVKCWGRNDSGQLGDGTTASRAVPLDVPGFSSGVSAITAGDSHTCALTSGGAVKCWGRNTHGELGNNSTANSLTPVEVSGLSSGVSAISAGWGHTCALTSTGAVKCWGNNSEGQLGNNSTNNSLTPVDVSGLSSGVLAISAGGFHTCALKSTMAAVCWGLNGAGQLGDGSTTDRWTPVTVSGLSSGVIAVSSGREHTCALVSGGAARCWGQNSSGQLGDGTVDRRLEPAAVTGLSSGVTSISAGREHTCALSSGTARCWGSNDTGQLGDGTRTESLVPLAVAGLTTDMGLISAGFTHTCSLTTGGQAWCWGANSYGELGNWTTEASLAPAAVNTTGTCFTLSTAVTGSGTINANPLPNCGAQYTSVTTVQLTASPDGGSSFNSWSGDASGTANPTSVTMNANRNVTANFTSAVLSLTSLDPTAVLAGTAGATLTVNGTGFLDGAQVQWNGSARTTTFVSSTRLTAALTAADLAPVAVNQVTVVNPGPSVPSNTLQVSIHTFADSTPTDWHWKWVEGLYSKRITGGCDINPFRYCPDRVVTRAEMAVFILKAQNEDTPGYAPDPAQTGIFADVPVAGKEWMQAWIEEFYEQGITGGCDVNPFRYCPERQVTRAEMSVFILRAVHGAGYTPPAATGIFADVPVPGKEWMQPWVEQFYREGITGGCNTDPLRFCPERQVTRAEMAAFIDRAFGFPQVP